MRLLKLYNRDYMLIILDFVRHSLWCLDHLFTVSVFKRFYTLHTTLFTSPCRNFSSNSPLLIQMVTWSFRDALEELELRHQFDDSMLKSGSRLTSGGRPLC